MYLKAENMQRSGSFKVRGASYKLSRLSEEEYSHGVITASAGNHAQGVAIAAAQYGIPCTIVMPETAPLAPSPPPIAEASDLHHTRTTIPPVSLVPDESANPIKSLIARDLYT